MANFVSKYAGQDIEDAVDFVNDLSTETITGLGSGTSSASHVTGGGNGTAPTFTVDSNNVLTITAGSASNWQFENVNVPQADQPKTVIKKNN